MHLRDADAADALQKDALLIAEAGLRDPWVRTGSRKALLSRVEALCKPPLRWIKVYSLFRQSRLLASQDTCSIIV